MTNTEAMVSAFLAVFRVLVNSSLPRADTQKLARSIRREASWLGITEEDLSSCDLMAQILDLSPTPGPKGATRAHSMLQAVRKLYRMELTKEDIIPDWEETVPPTLQSAVFPPPPPRTLTKLDDPVDVFDRVRICESNPLTPAVEDRLKRFQDKRQYQVLCRPPDNPSYPPPLPRFEIVDMPDLEPWRVKTAGTDHPNKPRELLVMNFDFDYAQVEARILNTLIKNGRALESAKAAGTFSPGNLPKEINEMSNSNWYSSGRGKGRSYYDPAAYYEEEESSCSGSSGCHKSGGKCGSGGCTKPPEKQCDKCKDASAPTKRDEGGGYCRWCGVYDKYGTAGDDGKVCCYASLCMSKEKKAAKASKKG